MTDAQILDVVRRRLLGMDGEFRLMGGASAVQVTLAMQIVTDEMVHHFPTPPPVSAPRSSPSAARTRH
jgi:hypothetical protein